MLYSLAVTIPITAASQIRPIVGAVTGRESIERLSREVEHKSKERSGVVREPRLPVEQKDRFITTSSAAVVQSIERLSRQPLTGTHQDQHLRLRVIDTVVRLSQRRGKPTAPVIVNLNPGANTASGIQDLGIEVRSSVNAQSGEIRVQASEGIEMISDSSWTSPVASNTDFGRSVRLHVTGLGERRLVVRVTLNFSDAPSLTAVEIFRLTSSPPKTAPGIVPPYVEIPARKSPPDKH